jgi:hypothetical protein
MCYALLQLKINDEVKQRTSFAKFSHYIVVIILFIHVEELDDIWMVQLFKVMKLVEKAEHILWIHFGLVQPLDSSEFIV